MGNKKQQQEDNRIIIFVGLIALVLVISFFARVGIFSSYDMTYDDICSIEFGDNWKYEYDDFFGKTCVEVDYISLNIINRTSFNWTSDKILDKYCPEDNKFWDLSKWSNGCEDWRISLNKTNGK